MSIEQEQKKRINTAKYVTWFLTANILKTQQEKIGQWGIEAPDLCLGAYDCFSYLSLPNCNMEFGDLGDKQEASNLIRCGYGIFLRPDEVNSLMEMVRMHIQKKGLADDFGERRDITFLKEIVNQMTLEMRNSFYCMQGNLDERTVLEYQNLYYWQQFLNIYPEDMVISKPVGGTISGKNTEVYLRANSFVKQRAKMIMKEK